MISAASLFQPSLDARLLGAHRVPALTDEELFCRTGVRIAFTGRGGGVSEGPYASLNLGLHVNDDSARVLENRRRLLEAAAPPETPLIVPSQVHGSTCVTLFSTDEAALADARSRSDAGCDAVVGAVAGVAVLLNFADCLSLIIVSPTGRFAVVHAGWRGAVAGIAGAAVRELLAADAAGGGRAFDAGSLIAYIGPHIRSECFECGCDVRERFVERFGASVAPDVHHVDLARAVSCDLTAAGLPSERIVDARRCTRCGSDEYFSYRAAGGICGRHGAFAYREER